MRLLSIVLLTFLGAPAVTDAQAVAFRTPAAVPAPESFFGFRMGADRRLAAWPEMVKYFEMVAAASDRVALVDVGPTTDGNRVIGAVISAPENLTRLDAIKSANRQLADPRTISEAQAQRLIESHPVIIAIGRRDRRVDGRHGPRPALRHPPPAPRTVTGHVPPALQRDPHDADAVASRLLAVAEAPALRTMLCSRALIPDGPTPAPAYGEPRL